MFHFFKRCMISWLTCVQYKNNRALNYVCVLKYFAVNANTVKRRFYVLRAPKLLEVIKYCFLTLYPIMPKLEKKITHNCNQALSPKRYNGYAPTLVSINSSFTYTTQLAKLPSFATGRVNLNSTAALMGWRADIFMVHRGAWSLQVILWFLRENLEQRRPALHMYSI